MAADLCHIAASELSAASQFAPIDESLFPRADAALLARRIDWWIAHQAERAEWREIRRIHQGALFRSFGPQVRVIWNARR